MFIQGVFAAQISEIKVKKKILEIAEEIDNADEKKADLRENLVTNLFILSNIFKTIVGQRLLCGKKRRSKMRVGCDAG